MVQTLLLFAAIATPAFSVVIECEFGDWPFNAFGWQYPCEVIGLKNLYISEVTEVNGNHMNNRTNADVEVFWSDGNKTGVENSLLTFPKNLEKYFPSLFVIYIGGHRLTKIASEDLAPWPKLTVLSLYDNRIKKLDADLFQHSPKLATANFGNNLIKNVGAGLLSNLNELKEANFRGNPCIEFSAYAPQAIEELKGKLLSQCKAAENSTA